MLKLWMHNSPPYSVYMLYNGDVCTKVHLVYIGITRRLLFTARISNGLAL